MFLNYKQKADKNKAKIINNDTKKFKKLCMKKFKENIKNGLDITEVGFYLNGMEFSVNLNFEDEIADRVLSELKQEYNNIEFTIVGRHYMNTYKTLRMVAK